jgi:UDPglucose--hexose-1-phosphate uridylyltransferase
VDRPAPDHEHVSGPGARVDPLTGATTWIVPGRQGRPNLPGTGCPFCPGGLEAPEPYEVLAFPNRWPPFPDGGAEIVLYTPDHEASFADLSPAQARRVVDLWAERSAVLGARESVAYVLVFENRGPEVGATIAHPHGQIYAFDSVPPAALVELDDARPGVVRGVGLGPDAPGDRLVSEASGGWRAWVPVAATWPYELLLAPDPAVPDLPSLDDEGRDGLAALLIDVVGRLDRLFDAAMPLMSWVHQRPFDGGEWPTARLHLHVAPLLRDPGTPRFVAAGELGSGVWFNPVDPVDAAERLRRA